MTLTLLIDLDDTLLKNSMTTFIPAYLNCLGVHLAEYTPPEVMAKTMLAATQHMFTNNQIDRTLEESFDPAFYPPLDLVKGHLIRHLDHFYDKIFPTLRNITQPILEAVEFIESALERGYTIGIATNPLFPRSAIIQRLEWAGLSPEKYPFALIPSYESFHYAKPNPAFFAEFLGKLGWPDGPTLMIGNDPDHDVRGARGIGIPVFWISEGSREIPKGFPPPDGSGTLQDILPWIDAQPEGSLQPNYSSQSALVAILQGSASALISMASNFPAYLWNECPEPKEWCITEIICHLRDVETEINLPRLQKIKMEANPFIPGIDSDAWAKVRSYKDQQGDEALQDFIASRKKTLELIRNLASEDWSLPAQHAIFGPTTLHEMINIMARHDQLHIRQVYQTIQTIKRSVDYPANIEPE